MQMRIRMEILVWMKTGKPFRGTHLSQLPPLLKRIAKGVDDLL